MIIYLLPKINKNIYKYLGIQKKEEKPDPLISHSLSFYLNDTKSQIEGYENKWDIFKKYTNTFEYIHSTIPCKKTCVSKYKPISRSYFKMVELIDEFQLGLDSPNPIQTFHLAEGPGGFIEAVINHRKNTRIFRQISPEDKVGINGELATSSASTLVSSHNPSEDIYIGMTLLVSSDNDNPPPSWKKIQSFLKKNNNILLERGVDKTGNILSLPNLIRINEMYGNTMDFVTADGGFDFSGDFSNQELSMTRLLYGQIVFALCIQKRGGCFVLKIFDCFMRSTVELLALLCSVYDQVYITKPHTSRSANSEKYIVCKGFNHSSTQLYPYLFFSFKEMLEGAPFISSFFYRNVIPQYFTQKMEKYNGIMGEKQLENIRQTLELMKEDETNIWCKKEDKIIKELPVRFMDNISENGRRTFCSDIYTSEWGRNGKTNINTLVKMNVTKCYHWCIKHNIATE